MKASRRNRLRRVTTVWLMAAALCCWRLAAAGLAQQVSPETAPARGIAVLASSIGSEYPVEALAEFVHNGGFSPVVVDWAWITAHWERTNFAEVNRLVEILSADGIEVAAMYRPRFLGEATVPIQLKGDGTPATAHGSHICFSSEKARQWGSAWGTKILEKCPGFGEIIIYNPLNLCECPRCLQVREADAFGHYSAVWSFLAEARAAWRARKPDVKLGIVFVADAEFWARGKQIVDVARPFLIVREDADMQQNMAAVRAVRDALKDKAAASLAKITWGPGEKVSPDKLATFDRLARDNGIPYFFWTFDTLFLSEMYDTPAVAEALGLEHRVIEQPLQRIRAARTKPAANNGRAYTLEEIQETDAETFFQRLARPAPGYHHFSAMRALTEKGKTGGAAAAHEIVDRAMEIMLDGGRPLHQRWQCCYVVSGIGDERGIPALARLLHEDDNEIVRSVAACALGRFPTDEAIRALEQAAERESSARVLGSVNKALRGDFKRTVASAAREASPEGVSVPDALAGKCVPIVLVKDFLRMENTGPELKDVEFERYFPAVDAEQIVVARWVSAQSDAGETIPVSVAKVVPDVQGNLIHTWRLRRFPERQQVLVTVTSLVARRERPAPEGQFPIPAPTDYPPEVRPFLSSTAMVASDHPEIRKQAEEILAQTRDAYQVARRLASIMKAKSYKQIKRREPGLPTAVSVLRYGGSCCRSAVCAAAVLRASGIPTQLTYAPAGYVHGIVRFYLNGYGWVRMDATCGTGKLPLVQTEHDLGRLRLFDMPIEMETTWYAYAWPYYHNDADGKYHFRSEGRVCDAVQFAHKGAPDPDGVAGRVAEPFPHLESGSWNKVLGSQPFEGPWRSWDALAQASRAAVLEPTMGEFDAVTAKVPSLASLITFARDFGKQEPDQ